MENKTMENYGKPKEKLFFTILLADESNKYCLHRTGDI
jgi:hypothetical protein